MSKYSGYGTETVYDANQPEIYRDVEIGWGVDSPLRIARHVAEKWFEESSAQEMSYDLLVMGYVIRVKCCINPDTTKAYPLIACQFIDPSPEQLKACRAKRLFILDRKDGVCY